MKPHARSLIPPEDVHTWEEVSACVRALPDNLPHFRTVDVPILSGHLLARAVAEVFSLRAVDGYYFSRGHQHSWVTTRHDNILDVYPVAALGGPLLLHNVFGSPAHRLYHPLEGKELKRMYEDRFDELGFIRAARVLTAELRRIRADIVI